jgi:cytoskeletal protein CcmA (bactofilin family)
VGPLVVGEGAHVNASISVNSVLIGGDVHGDIHVKERLKIYFTGRLWGTVRTPSLIIEQGVFFEGTSDMDKTVEADHND